MDGEKTKQYQKLQANLRQNGIYQVTTAQAVTAAGKAFSFMADVIPTEGGVGETRWVDVYHGDIHKCRFTFTPKGSGTTFILNWFDGDELARMGFIALVDFDLKGAEAAVAAEPEPSEGQSDNWYKLLGDTGDIEYPIEAFSIVRQADAVTFAKWLQREMLKLLPQNPILLDGEGDEGEKLAFWITETPTILPPDVCSPFPCVILTGRTFGYRDNDGRKPTAEDSLAYWLFHPDTIPAYIVACIEIRELAPSKIQIVGIHEELTPTLSDYMVKLRAEIEKLFEPVTLATTTPEPSAAQPQPSAEPVRLQQAPSGRPSDPAYDEAAARINGGEKWDAVFSLFCANQNTKPDKSVRDSFKAAMKRRGVKASK